MDLTPLGRLAHLIEGNAKARGLEPALVAAIVMQESSGDPWATRFEPGYRWLWDCNARAPFRHLTSLEVAASRPPLDFSSFPGVAIATEWAGQRTSWGLMQVMGAVAREHGFRGRFLSELTDPATGLKYGCTLLATLYERWHGAVPGGMEAVLSAYNAGHPTEANRDAYVWPVLRLREKILQLGAPSGSLFTRPAGQ